MPVVMRMTEYIGRDEDIFVGPVTAANVSAALDILEERSPSGFIDMVYPIVFDVDGNAVKLTPDDIRNSYE